MLNGTHFQPYCENHTTNPLSVYGKSKHVGEEALFEVNPTNAIIIRTSWVYSSYGNNFVKTMIRLAKERESLNVIYDQIGTPTYAKDLAYIILEILPKIDNKAVEIYHYSNEGVASWYDFAKEIISCTNLTCKIEPIATEQYPLPAKRPYYSLLNKAKIKKTFGITIPYWKESLKICLSHIQNA
ncbi:MAG: sugar nucleotide-binding protein [Sulfurospirillaceae bacterium]|nr:sugar nucleotide-binding protein [Sulfurospirillaceae bacterium]